MVACDLHIDVRKDSVSVRFGDDAQRCEMASESVLAELHKLRPQLNPIDYGARLFDTVFAGELVTLYHRALEDKQKICRVHVNLESTLDLVHEVNWEALTTMRPSRRHLGYSHRTPLSRRIPSSGADAAGGVNHSDKVKVLVVVANPRAEESARFGVPMLDERAELDAVREVQHSLRDRMVFDVERGPATLQTIGERISAENFQVLHVVGHGARGSNGDEDCLVLQDASRIALGATRQDLGRLVSGLPSLRLVVLAGAHGPRDSGQPVGSRGADVLPRLGAALLEHGVPAVVAIRHQLDPESARLFAATFYRNLVRSETGMVDQAINRARETIFFKRRDTWEWTAPVLLMSGDGMLFAPQPVAERVAPRTVETARPARGPEPTPRFIGGKPSIEPAKHVPRPTGFMTGKREQLFDALAELQVTRDRVDTLYWKAEIDPRPPVQASQEAEYRQLIDTFHGASRLDWLEIRIRQLQNAPAIPQEHSNLYDLHEHRAAREVTV